MRPKGIGVVLLVVGLLLTAGCGGGGRRGKGAGAYIVQVVDVRTNRGIEQAVVEWDYYFSSQYLDPAQRPNWGLGITGPNGITTIPPASLPAGFDFQELNVVVSAAGYHESRKTIREGRGTILFQLVPIEMR